MIHTDIIRRGFVSRRTFLATSLLAMVAASAPFGAPIAWADGADDAGKFVTDLAHQAIGLMANASLSDPDRTTQFRKMFVSAFDLPEIGQFVLGRYWRDGSPDQQQQFLHLFEDYQVLIWSRRFKDYHGEQVQVEGTASGDNGGWQVNSKITRPNNQPPIAVQWKVHQANGSWKITDLVVDGVSMALTQRQDFAGMMRNNGGKFDALISAMNGKVSQLQGQG